MHKYVQQLMFLGSLLLVCGQLQAQATLSVQGNIIQNFTGAAIDNGTYDITFRLYTTDTGGSPLWSETQSVNMIGGVYSVLLGAVNPLNLPFDQTYYLGLTLPGGPEHTPRTQLTAAPYALSLLGQDNKFPSTGMVKMEAVATGQASTTATSYAVAADDHVIFLDHTANQNVTLPAATAANAGRHLVLVNKEAVAKTLTSSNYVDLAGGTSTNVPANGVVELQSDGSVWRQTGGYVQPVTVGKAYVRCKSVNQNNNPYGYTTVQSTELIDAQNCWNPTTHTFTAPRTGTYRISSNFMASGVGNLVYVSVYVNGTDEINWGSNTTQGVYQSTNFSTDQPMTANQTLQIRIYNNSTVGVTNILGGSGFLTITEL